jgi:hypothetical protein
MKTKITVPKEPCPVFPALYRNINAGFIVLFTDTCSGTVIVPGGRFEIRFEIGHCESESMEDDDSGWCACTNSAMWDRLPSGTEIVLTQE